MEQVTYNLGGLSSNAPTIGCLSSNDLTIGCLSSNDLTIGCPSDANSILDPNTLTVCLTRGKREIREKLYKSFGAFEQVVLDVDGEKHVYKADDILAILESFELQGGASSE